MSDLMPIDYQFTLDVTNNQKKVKTGPAVEVATFLNLLNSRRGLYSDIPDFHKNIGELRYADNIDLNGVASEIVEMGNSYIREGFVSSIEHRRDEMTKEVFINIKLDIPGMDDLALTVAGDRIVPVNTVEDVYGSR